MTFYPEKLSEIKKNQKFLLIKNSGCGYFGKKFLNNDPVKATSLERIGKKY